MPIMSSFFARPHFFLTVLLLTAACLRAPLTATGPVLEDIRLTFGLTATDAGLLNFIPLMMFALLAPPAAWSGNRFGLEKTLWVAIWLILAGSAIRISGSSLALWLGTALLSGGIAAANVLLPPLIKRDFSQHAARYIALYACVMSITASVASGIAVPLAGLTNAGWFFSLGVWLIPAAIALAAWLPLLKNAHPLKSGATRKDSALRSPWRAALGWQVSLFMGLQSLAFYTLIAWFTPWAEAQGFSQLAAGWLLFLYQIVAIAANLACMRAMVRLRDQRAIALLASLAIFIGLCGLYLWPPLAILWLTLAGLGAGASLVISLSLFGLRAGNHYQASRLSGMAQCVGYGLAALGPLFFGLLHQRFDNWTAPLLFLIALSLLQVAIAPLAGRNKVIG